MRTELLIPILLFFTLLGIPAISSAQSGEITEAEFYSGLRSGFSATGKVFPRRETNTIERFDEGNLIQTIKITYEYHSADTIYVLTEVRKDGNVSVDELIRIGKDLYCKENEGTWTKNATDCYLKPPPPKKKPQESRYMLEKVGVNGTGGYAYSSLETYMGSQSGKTEPTKFLSEYRLLLNTDSTMRNRTIVTSIESPKTVILRTTNKYEYEVKLPVIVAPIKSEIGSANNRSGGTN